MQVKCQKAIIGVSPHVACWGPENLASITGAMLALLGGIERRSTNAAQRKPLNRVPQTM
jgi:hypothetical protein